MTDYITRPIPVIPGNDYSSPRDAYIFTGPIPPPTMWPIQDTDGTTQIIPQPVRWFVMDSTQPVDTLQGGLSWTGVMDAIEKGPEGHAEPSVAGRGVPVWAIACVFAGLVLMALCAVMLTVVLPLQHTF